MKIAKLLLPIALLTACSSSPKKDVEGTEMESATAPSTTAYSQVTEAPSMEAESYKATMAADADVERPKAAPAASQYAALNEAIRTQSDERIYTAATQILTMSPNDAKALNALAMYHYKKGRLDLAKYLLNKGINANPRTGELHSNLGVVLLAQKENRDAVKSFRKALEINSEDAVAASNLGAIYVQEKDFTKANVVLDTAYRKGVRDPKVLNNYAIALTASAKYDRAEDIYKLLMKEQNNKEILFNYAVLLVERLGKYQDGLEVINRLKFVGGPADTRNKIIALENKAKAGLK